MCFLDRKMSCPVSVFMSVSFSTQKDVFPQGKFDMRTFVQAERNLLSENKLKNNTINAFHSTTDNMLCSNIIHMTCGGCGAKHSIWKHGNKKQSTV